MDESEQIRGWIRHACNANGVPTLAERIHFRFRGNFTRILGQAFYKKKLIEFSSPLWERASPEEKEQVVIHEACHIIADYKHGTGIKPHGFEWRRAMIQAGKKPERCHNVSTKGLERQYVKYAVTCGCTTVWVGHVKANKVRERKLTCSACKNRLTLTGDSYRIADGKIKISSERV